MKYSEEGSWVLDQFAGSGTTLVEAKLLNRNAIGVDINPKAIALSEKNLNFESGSRSKIVLKNGSAVDLAFIKDNKIDFICTHPPYADIIKYSDGIAGDLSILKEKEFVGEILKVAKESYRVLKNGKYCAVMIGDIRQKGNVVPLGFELMQQYLCAGFKLKEIIIKEQHNCKSTDKWAGVKKSFLLLAHEYIFVFYK